MFRTVGHSFFSPRFSAAGINEMQLEFFPLGRKPDGSNGVFQQKEIQLSNFDEFLYGFSCFNFVSLCVLIRWRRARCFFGAQSVSKLSTSFS